MITLGNAAVGKTCLIRKYCDDAFDEDYQPTLGIDFMSKKENLPDGTLIKARIYDTAGQERYHTITSSYYNHCHGVFFTFALDDKQSFDQVEEWVERFNENANPDQPRILIGNKCDLNREVSDADAKALAAKLNCQYFETSAKDGTNVNKAFLTLLEMAFCKKTGKPFG